MDFFFLYLFVVIFKRTMFCTSALGSSLSSLYGCLSPTGCDSNASVEMNWGVSLKKVNS